MKYLRTFTSFATIHLLVSFGWSQFSFQKFDQTDGLSQNSVGVILQDSRGFMWFGTDDGLNRFDGYRFKHYPQSLDHHGLSDTHISGLLEDDSGNIWISTIDGGLNRLSLSSGTFSSYTSDDSNGLSSNRILTIEKGDNGLLWIGTDSGLHLFDPDKEVFWKLSSEVITKLRKDAAGRLWVGTSQGLRKILSYDTTNLTLREESYLENGLGMDPVISAIQEYQNGYMYVGTEWGSIFGVGSNTKDVDTLFHHKLADYYFTEGIHSPEFEAYLDEPKVNLPIKDFHFFDDSTGYVGTDGGGIYHLTIKETGSISIKASLRSDNVKSMEATMDNILTFYQDREDLVWIGTDGGGVLKSTDLKKNQSGFYHISPYQRHHSSLTYHDMGAFLYDEQEQELWVGLWGDGIDIFHVSENECSLTLSKKRSIKADINHPDSLNQVAVIALIQDLNNDIWMATPGGGINIYDPVARKFTLKQHDPNNDQTLSSNVILSLLIDSKDQIWAGTIDGLNLYNRETDQFTRIYAGNGEKDLPGNLIHTLYEDKTGSIWIGTDKGLSQITSIVDNPQQVGFQNYEHRKDDPNSISDNSILGIHHDSKGHLWIGTEGGGLNKLNLTTQEFERYNTKDGLANNVVYGILEDRKGFIWLSTNNGLSRFDPNEKKFRNYFKNDGLQHNEFNRRAYLKMNDDWLIFGGINGFNYFSPSCMPENTSPPPIAITDVQILNESITAGTELSSGFTVEQEVSSLNKIRLAHNENLFTVGFSVLSFHSSDNNQYAYKLEGFDAEWTFNGADRRYATYTNLDPGKYVLKLKGSNAHGYWNNEGVNLEVVILPAPWKTWWAYALYLIAFLMLVGYIVRTLIIRARLKTNLRIEQVGRKKMEELDQMKSRFFAGISHEFRTPLMLISAPVDQLDKRFMDDAETHWTFQIIRRNIDRLLRLINQMLDLSKLEAGKLRLQVSKDDITSFMKVIASSFESIAQDKAIRFDLQVPSSPIILFFDKEKLEQVLLNLLYNAFKFTDTGGKVALGLEKKDRELIISVINEGPEISKSEMEMIFDRFYQGEQKSAEGTGIGLALVKEFVELHHGTIKVSSDGGLTSFAITLPTDEKAYHMDEKISLEETKVFHAVEQQEATINDQPISEEDEDKPKILIIEDNMDLRNYIAHEIGTDYYTLVAADGEEGLDIANREIPDLVITDIMMPKVDGIALLKCLKENQTTNHIPVIMLTAKAERETRLEGIEKGADHYLQKPFDMEELAVRISSLLKQRLRIRDHFYREFLANPRSEEVSSMDDVFLKKAIQVIEEQLDNHEFSIDQFAKELAMSRVQLHRKMKAIVGCAASDFLRQYRLKKAYIYLQGKKGSVSQIAYSVGFNNHSYFTKAFKEVYHTNPSELLKD